jgi:NhaP-type Na+/H+ or K+/H+ antiporter
MIPTIQIPVLLLVVIAAAALIAARLKIPPAILLVLTGVVLALVPGLPTVELAPSWFCFWYCRPSSTHPQWR